MNVPDFLPVLSAGGHQNPAQGACFMEWASILAGESFTDRPVCSHPVLTRLAQAVNDRLPDSERGKIAHLIPSVIGTAHPNPGSLEDRVLSVRLAAFLAEQVVGLAGAARPQAEAAIRAARAWADAPSDVTRNAAAASAAYAAGVAAYAAGVAAGDADAASAAYASAAYAAAYAAGVAAAYAAAAGVAGGPSRLIALLENGIAEHARLTGRNATPFDPQAWEAARQKVMA